MKFQILVLVVAVAVTANAGFRQRRGYAPPGQTVKPVASATTTQPPTPPATTPPPTAVTPTPPPTTPTLTPAPPTAPPVTPAPTPAPVTPAPVTPAPVTPAPPANSGAPPAIIEYAINDLRTRHGVPAITASDATFISKAQQCADYYQITKQVDSNDNSKIPTDYCPYDPQTAQDMFGVGGNAGIDQLNLIQTTWYNELKTPTAPGSTAYDYENPDMTGITGYYHAHQLIWAATTKCGCAISKKPIAAAATNGTNTTTSGRADFVGIPLPVDEIDGGFERDDNESFHFAENEDSDDEDLGDDNDEEDIFSYGGLTRQSATPPQYVHVCVCDVSPNGRKPNYVANVKAPTPSSG